MNENLQMDNDLAVKLLKEGAVLLFLDIPIGSEFGIDMKVWTTDHKFKGIKMIPAGLHFVYYSIKNTHGDMAPRAGFLRVFKKGEFVIRKWDSTLEDVSNEEIGDDEKSRYEQNLMDLDKFLGPYPYDTYDKWNSFTKHISDNVVKKLNPETGYIRSATELVAAEKTRESDSKRRWSKSRTEEERQEDLLPELVPASGTKIRFTEMPQQRFPDGSSPAEITSHYLDSTYALNIMLSTCSNPIEFLGEIQFAFISFLIGLNWDSFEQWKRLVQLMCNCVKAIIRYTQMYTEFITCLDNQLEEIPEDFLVDIVANNNVIYRSLRDFFANLDLLKNDVDGRLYCKAERFKSKLTTKFGWDFTNLELEEGDDAPVIVKL